MIDGEIVQERPEEGSNNYGGEWWWGVLDVKKQSTADW